MGRRRIAGRCCASGLALRNRVFDVFVVRNVRGEVEEKEGGFVGPNEDGAVEEFKVVHRLGSCGMD